MVTGMAAPPTTMPSAEHGGHSPPTAWMTVPSVVIGAPATTAPGGRLPAGKALAGTPAVAYGDGWAGI
jgi:hypothetical protein